MMNTSEVAIRCGEHAFTRLQKLLPQQDRLLPKIYQTEDDQYIIYWDSIHWFESSDKREAELCCGRRVQGLQCNIGNKNLHRWQQAQSSCQIKSIL